MFFSKLLFYLTYIVVLLYDWKQDEHFSKAAYIEIQSLYCTTIYIFECETECFKINQKPEVGCKYKIYPTMLKFVYLPNILI